ncbi:MAG TPA: hypothetical protein VFG79_01985 [Solirubrobacter sp.]|nr:hypothetical protein [Solirubrobacter sp.]
MGVDEQVVDWRRHLHRQPEVSFEEHETSAFVAATLEDVGLAVERTFKRNAAVLPIYQLLVAFVFFVGFVAVLQVKLPEDGTDLALLAVAKDAFPAWFVGLIGSAGVLSALVPGSMLLIASATTVAKNGYPALPAAGRRARAARLGKQVRRAGGDCGRRRDGRGQHVHARRGRGAPVGALRPRWAAGAGR